MVTSRSMTFLQDLSLNPSSFVFCRCCIIFQNHRLYYLILDIFFARESINVCPVYENMLFLTVALKPSRQSEYMSKIPKYKKVINTQNSTHLLILIQSVLSSGNLAQLGSRKSEVGSWKLEVGSRKTLLGFRTKVT